MEIKNNTDIEKTNMENYKVILVDDEEEVIDAIKSRILWEQLGFIKLLLSFHLHLKLLP